MTALPNPFICESSSSTGGCQEAAAVVAPKPTAAGLLDDDDHRFRLDERAFMEAIKERPLFLRRAYMR